jgi:hypothetical protein
MSGRVEGEMGRCEKWRCGEAEIGILPNEGADLPSKTSNTSDPFLVGPIEFSFFGRCAFYFPGIECCI